MVKKRRKKPRTSRTVFWLITLLIIGALMAGWWLWSCLYNVSPQFNFILIQKDDQSLKLLNGETLHLHPKNRIRILNVSTNICFNRGVRLVADGFDIDALRYEEMPFSTLLPNRDILNRLTSRIRVKRYNRDMGYVDIVVEPYVEDWLNKADRSIDRERRIAILERALKVMPDNKRIRDRLIEEYKSLKNWYRVALMLEEMAKKNPDKESLYDLLEVYEAMSKKDGIISVLRRLIEEDPEDLDVRLRLASTLEKAGKAKEAIKEYEDLLKRMAKEDRLSVYKALGYLYTKTRQTKKAISNYRSAVELDKKDVNLYYNLFFLYQKIGQNKRADYYLRKAVSLRPADIEGRLRLSKRLIKKGKLKEAEKFLNEVLKKKPRSAEALLLKADIMEKRKDKEGLKKVYRTMLSLKPKNHTIIYNLGVLEYETGNLKKALSYFNKFLTFRPKDPEVHDFLFDIYRREKKDQLAYMEALTLIKLRPKEIRYYHFLFEYLNNQGDYKKMIETMKDGIQSHPKSIDLRRYLILAYLKTGDEHLAINQVDEILKIRPNDIISLLQLAKLKEKQGNFKESLESYKKIVDISPDHEEAEEAYLRVLLQLAQFEEEQGNFKEALEYFKKIVDISPGHEEAEEAYLRLRLKVLPTEKDRQ
ncbi:MAG: tetratricopeptide repeat protein [Deltaproteobacteria bacterium]|nr:tetratricopeptide repeat protein [Deltaproteobacteria bacterium]MBL7175079.1 tetratricopeptide repeat protein [Desulfobacteraceae bacterium]